MFHLGVDQSYTSTGWCVHTDLENCEYGVITTVPDKNDELSVFRRARVIADEIVFLIAKYDITEVTLEGLAMGNVPGNSGRNLAGLQFMIVDAILKEYEECEIIINIVAPTALKKFATGKGNSKKDAMFEALPDHIKDKFSKIPKTKGRFDVTDAYWLSLYTSQE